LQKKGEKSRSNFGAAFLLPKQSGLKRWQRSVAQVGFVYIFASTNPWYSSAAGGAVSSVLYRSGERLGSVTRWQPSF
jgi:hypothetical protein